VGPTAVGASSAGSSRKSASGGTWIPSKPIAVRVDPPLPVEGLLAVLVHRRAARRSHVGRGVGAGHGVPGHAGQRQQPAHPLVDHHHRRGDVVGPYRLHQAVEQAGRHQRAPPTQPPPGAERGEVPGPVEIQPCRPSHSRHVEGPGRSGDVLQRLQAQFGRPDQPNRADGVATRLVDPDEHGGGSEWPVLLGQMVGCVAVGLQEHRRLALERGSQLLAGRVEPHLEQRGAVHRTSRSLWVSALLGRRTA
jgi:hypothetical protein